jgi:hypothetical protein
MRSREPGQRVVAGSERIWLWERLCGRQRQRSLATSATTSAGPRGAASTGWAMHTYPLLPVRPGREELPERLPGRAGSSCSLDTLRRFRSVGAACLWARSAAARRRFSSWTLFCCATMLWKSLEWLKMSSPSLLGASCQAARLNSERFLGAAAAAGVASVMTAPCALGAWGLGRSCHGSRQRAQVERHGSGAARDAKREVTCAGAFQIHVAWPVRAPSPRPHPPQLHVNSPAPLTCPFPAQQALCRLLQPPLMSTNGDSPAPDAAGDSRDPSGFLSEIIGAPVTVKLNSGIVYKGTSFHCP